MLKQSTLLILLGLATLLTGCKKDINTSAPAASVQPSQIYYTQFSLFEEKDNYRTTNYRKGILLPINTEVTLVAMDPDDAKLRVASTGQILNIENVPKFTIDSMPIAFSKIVSTGKVNLNQFTAAEREMILLGQVKPGMSKKATLAAIGYPPQHETPSTEGDRWTYWTNRFNKFIVVFKNGKVDSVVD